MHVIKGLLELRRFLALCFHLLLPEGSPLLFAILCSQRAFQIAACFPQSVDFGP